MPFAQKDTLKAKNDLNEKNAKRKEKGNQLHMFST